MLQDFLSFLSQYNVIGIAVGLLIATKAGDLVKGLIDDLITPLILGPILKKLKLKTIEELSFRGILYGNVISTTIDFLITAFLIFLVIKYAHLTVIPAAIK